MRLSAPMKQATGSEVVPSAVKASIPHRYWLVFAGILAVAIALYALYGKITGAVPVQGWASLLIIVAFFSGCILTALGVIAEYLAVTMGIAMGKPLYVVSSKPTRPVVRQ